MIAGIISGVFVIIVCVLAWVLCKAASEWDHWGDDDYD